MIKSKVINIFYDYLDKNFDIVINEYLEDMKKINKNIDRTDMEYIENLMRTYKNSALNGDYILKKGEFSYLDDYMKDKCKKGIPIYDIQKSAMGTILDTNYEFNSIISSNNTLSIVYKAYCALKGLLHNFTIVLGFEEFTELLNSYGPKTQAEIIFSMISFNLGIIKKFSQEKSLVLLNNIDSDFEFKVVPTDKVIDLIVKFNLVTFDTNNIYDDSLSEEENKQREELIEYIKYSDKKNSDVIKSHKIIEDHYFSKNGKYNQNDIDEVIKALKTIKVDENICSNIRQYLESKKEKTDETGISINIFENQDKNNKKKYLTKKEYNLIVRELENYFDFDEMKALRTLTLEEVLHCILLLNKIGTEKHIIVKFLKTIEKLNISKNPIVRFNELYEKLKYYENIPGIKENIELLQLYMKESCFIQSDEKYNEVKHSMNELLSETLDEIPKTYEYEFKMVNKLN